MTFDYECKCSSFTFFNQPRKLVSNYFWVILFPFSCIILSMRFCSKGHTHDEEIVWPFKNAQEGIFLASCKLPSASTIFTGPLLQLHLYFIFHQSSMADSCNPLSPSLYRPLENSIISHQFTASNKNTVVLDSCEN